MITGSGIDIEELSEMPITDLEAYSPEYEGLFARVCNRAASKQGPTNEELLCIVKWKLDRIRGEYFTTVHRNGDTIRELLIEAGTLLERSHEAIKNLIQIPWIKLAMASAFLTFCWPEQFTVLDRRVLQELKAIGCHTPPWPTESKKWATDVDGYLNRYLPAVAHFQQANQIQSLREADRALWGRSVRKQIQLGLTATTA